VHVPAVTASIILANFIVWGLELHGGDAFVLKWSAIPKDITSGHHWITILTAMFLHGSWSHILGNMVFLWAFGPEIEDSMSRLRYLVFYIAGGLVAMIAQVLVVPSSTIPNLGASGAIAAVMGAFLVTYPGDRIRFPGHLYIRAHHFDSSGSSDWILVSHPTFSRRVYRIGPNGRCGLRRPRCRCNLRRACRPPLST
jgi:membrane associated rhomboid family serine protease